MTDTTVNGQIQPELLTDDAPMTAGYRPSLPFWAFWQPDGTPLLYILRDIELMILHPVVHQALEYYKSGISGAEFEVKCPNTMVAEFVEEHCKRFWDRGVPKVQDGYEYGWMGCENLYNDHDGLLQWEGLLEFSPRDSYLLTRDSQPIGVRIKNIKNKNNVDLWTDKDEIPSKGLWYAHRPRFGSFYGRSQCIAAWRPWKRLAWKDGAESVIDGAIYRFGYAGPWVRYPPDDFQAPQGIPNTSLDSQGRPRRFARDLGRQMAEQLRAGGGGSMSSERWPADQGGGYKWEIEWPDHVINADPLINYAKYLHDLIYFGVGVPAELITSGETGSGYSGRKIPLEAFLSQQQRIADELLGIFVKQVLRPLVRWNFGPVKFDAKVKPLLLTKNRERQGMEPGMAPGKIPNESTPEEHPEQTSPAQVPLESGPVQAPRQPTPPMSSGGLCSGFSEGRHDPERTFP